MAQELKLLSVQDETNWDPIGTDESLEAVSSGVRIPDDAKFIRAFTTDPFRVRFENGPSTSEIVELTFRYRYTGVFSGTLYAGFYQNSVLKSFTVVSASPSDDFVEFEYPIPPSTVAALPNFRSLESAMQMATAVPGTSLELSGLGMRVSQTLAASFINVGVISRLQAVRRVTKQVGNIVTKSPGVRRISKQVVTLVMRIADIDEVVEPQPLPADAEVMFMHNWSDGFDCESSYRTSIANTLTGDEERLQLLNRPQKTIDTRLTVFSPARRNELLLFMKRASRVGFPIPFYPHRTRITSASASELFGDFEFKRFFKGQRVAVVRPRHGDTAYEFRYFAELQQVSSTSLQLKTSVVGDEANDFVLPLMDVNPVSELDADLTGDVLELNASFIQKLGQSALPGFPPKIYPNFQGYPVFEIQPEWSTGITMMVTQLSTRVGSGKDEIVFLMETQPQVNFRLNYTGRNQEAIYDLCQFYDNMKGMRTSFYLISPNNLGTPVEIDGADLVLHMEKEMSAEFSADIAADVTEVAIITDVGNFYYQSAAAISGSTLTLTLSPSIGVSFTVQQIKRVSVVRLSRFSTDAMRESWDTDGVMSITMGFIQLPAEGVVSYGSESS